MPPRASRDPTRYLPSSTRPTRGSLTVVSTAGFYGARRRAPGTDARRPRPGALPGCAVSPVTVRPPGSAPPGPERHHVGDVPLGVGVHPVLPHALEPLVVAGDGLPVAARGLGQDLEKDHAGGGVVVGVQGVQPAADDAGDPVRGRGDDLHGTDRVGDAHDALV